MLRLVLVSSLFMAGIASAQSVTSLKAERAPAMSAQTRLECPAGTRQFGGPRSLIGTMGCQSINQDGASGINGPFVAFDEQGNVTAMGQMVSGSRDGTWKVFSADGFQTDLVQFSRGDFNGRWVKFDVQGRVKSEENFVAGKRQGAQRTFDAAGKVTVVEYKDDRPLAAR